jgi:hypothetical protein
VAGKVHGLDTTDGDEGGGHAGDGIGSNLSERRPGEGGGHDGAWGGDTGHTEGTGETTRSHCVGIEGEEGRLEELEGIENARG